VVSNNCDVWIKLQSTRSGHLSEHTIQYPQVSHSWQKNPGLFHDFPGPTGKIFLNRIIAHACLNVTKIHHFLTVYGTPQVAKFISTIQKSNSQHNLGDILSQLVFHLSLGKNAWFSRIFFQDFRGLKWISRTFQVLEFSRKNTELSRRHWNPVCKNIHFLAILMADLTLQSWDTRAVTKNSRFYPAFHWVKNTKTYPKNPPIVNPMLVFCAINDKIFITVKLLKHLNQQICNFFEIFCSQ